MKLSLNSDWLMSFEGKNYPTSLPTGNYATLMQNGALPDPFYRDNEEKSLFVAENDCIFTKSFRGEFCDGEKVFLEIARLDTLAEVTLNGQTILRAKNAHITYTIDVTDVVKEENKLQILLRSPMKYIRKKAAEKYMPLNPNGPRGVQTLRKAACHFGWDWGPIIPESGIGGVSLYALKAKVTKLKVDQRHQDGEVSLLVAADKEIYVEELKEHLTESIEVSGNGFSFSEAYHNGMEIPVQNPKLWSVNKGTFDKQPLYTVTYTLRFGDLVVDSKILRIGLRTIELNREKDSIGQNFSFVLNGSRIFACGADVIPFDSIVSRETKEILEYYVKSAVRANMTILRVWGGGSFGRDEFYDLCDEYGILVWQDLLFACNLYPFHEKGFLEGVENEILFNVEHLRHHASLAVLCGNNEFEHMHYCWTNKNKWKDINRDFYYSVVPKMLEKANISIPYIPGSPIGDDYMKNVASDNYGDTHLWAVWHRLKPYEYYRKRLTRFCSEFGIESMPSKEAISSFAKDEDLSLTSPVFLKHQKCRKGNEKLYYYASMYFGLPKNFDDMIYISQLVQACGLCDAVENWRRNVKRCNGAIIWQYNDCWPTASWSMIDYLGKYKAIQYKARDLFAPISVSLEQNKGSVRAFLLNSTPEVKTVTVRCGVNTFEGDALALVTKSVKIDAMTAVEIYTAERKPLSNTNRCYFYAEILQGEKVLMQKTCLFDKARKVALPRCKISIEAGETADEFYAVITSDKYAENVMLDIEGVTEPLSDNFFTLEPNVPKTVSLAKDKVTKAQWHLLKAKTLTDVEMEPNWKRILKVLRFPLI